MQTALWLVHLNWNWPMSMKHAQNEGEILLNRRACYIFQFSSDYLRTWNKVIFSQNGPLLFSPVYLEILHCIHNNISNKRTVISVPLFSASSGHISSSDFNTKLCRASNCSWSLAAASTWLNSISILNNDDTSPVDKHSHYHHHCLYHYQ